MTWYPTQIPNIWYVLVAQSCPTLCHLMDCHPPGSSVQGVLQIRIQEWEDIPFSREFSQPRDRMQVSCIGSRILYRLSYQGREAKKNTKHPQILCWMTQTGCPRAPSGLMYCNLWGPEWWWSFSFSMFIKKRYLIEHAMELQFIRIWHIWNLLKAFEIL